MLPDPLHPAIVHFPIVLLLLGAPLAILAVFLRKWHLPVLAAIVLSLGAAGAFVATWTGGNDAEMAGELAGNGEQTLDEHEEWGERTRNAGIVAALLAITSAALIRKPVAGSVVGAVAAVAAVAAAFSVAQAGHYGGQVVYKYGAGVNTAAGTAAGESAASPAGGTEKKKHDKGDND
ncbi:MAG: DUF2231 domain-containing protein [Terrimicrobiaceae bacterium]